ncbi:hypothetical protein OB03_06380 [Brevundimonas sp. GN22]
MRAALILGAAFLVAACQQPQPKIHTTGPEPEMLVCEIGFEANVREIKARKMIESDEREHGSSAYFDRHLERVYIVTQPDHPAHPAIFMRWVVLTTESINFMTDACGYGDRDALNEAVGRYRAFDKLLDAEYPCYTCDNLRSPTLKYQFEAEYGPSPW